MDKKSSKASANGESRKEYLLLHTNKIRQSALIMGSIFVLLTIIMDFFRFPFELNKITIPLRFVFVLFPVTWLAYLYTFKSKSNQRIYIGGLFYISIATAIVHSYVVYSANLYGIFVPKSGLSIILIYSGLLLAMPAVFASVSSLIIIIQAGVTYYLLGEAIGDITIQMIFYTMFAACCVLINIICVRILLKNYKLVNIIKTQAFTDELTGLANRRHFYLEAVKRVKQAMRDGVNYGVVSLDLDLFKSANDNFGHKFGDDVLVQFSAILNSHCQRPLDFASRMGGDEFVMFLYGTQQTHIEKICRIILTQVNDLKLKVDKQKMPHYLSTSIGAIFVDTSNKNYLDMDDVIEKADKLLYRVKNASKNNFELETLTAKPLQSDQA